MSGFDPFGLDVEIRRSNPSAAAVLNLDGRTLSSPRGTLAEIQGVVFPVRFADFNAGVAERFFSPFLNATRPPDIVVTISQGDSDFELERYAGRRRSSGTYPDNLGTTAGVGPTRSVVPPGMGPGAEFIRTTASTTQQRAMVGSGSAGGFTVRLDSMVTTRSGQRLSGSAALAQGARAGRGSGGGYLSNEIFYRVVRIASSRQSRVPAIHLHTPRLHYAQTPSALAAERRRIVEGVEQILRRSIDAL